MMFLELMIRKETDSDVIETRMVCEVEMVILFVSDLVDFLGLVILWEGGEEQSQSLRRRRERFRVCEIGVGEHSGSGFGREIASGGSGSSRGGRGCRGGGGEVE